MDRRSLLGAMMTAPVLGACRGESPAAASAPPASVVGIDPVRTSEPLGFQWKTRDPFLFCVHHDDAYPAGNALHGPAASLAGRQLGSDFAGIGGWRMYHGEVVPGFPQHPHRGFETVTIVRRGLVDHSDSLGAAARYGGGDVQWLTAGRGIVHAEMFPLLERVAPNPLELFQIWMNLPKADKFAAPHFSMFWRDTIPRHTVRDAAGKLTELTVIAGRIGAQPPGAPPPQSWAARESSDVAIWTIRMDPNARFELPAVSQGTTRMLYFFRGEQLTLGPRTVPGRQALELATENAVSLLNGPQEAELLLLQGRPIGEPVVQQGPFVMNSPQEIREAYQDYRRTGFGVWSWPEHAPVHGSDPARFARHADGRIERAT
jgi:redox-sensitive bicupin YhaK (pirin superfamily)